jgi:LacI family transcriptional regulator
MKNQIKIAFAHNENGHNDKGISAGITQYIRSTGRFQLIAWPDNSFESISFLKKQGCRGAIANIATSATANRLLQTGIPIIAYSTVQDMGKVPFISSDSREVARIAFEYLSNKQFKNFAFFGLTEARWTRERLKHFSDFVSQAGYSLKVFSGKPIHVANNLPGFAKLWVDTTMKRGQQDLIHWIEELPRPVAVLVSCDILGAHMSYLVSEIGLSVPDDIAILGIDNNEALCNICSPRLSSIALNLNKAGYDAAELLDRIITGKEELKGQQIKIQPLQVKERGSTDIFAINDLDVIKALKYIRTHSYEPLQVEEIARHVCISKRSLQMKFQQILNTSIHDEIIHSHFLIARNLLLETDLSIENIAIQSGFHYSSNMRRAFMDFTGMLPCKYRQTHRGSQPSAR